MKLHTILLVVVIGMQLETAQSSTITIPSKRLIVGREAPSQVFMLTVKGEENAVSSCGITYVPQKSRKITLYASKEKPEAKKGKLELALVNRDKFVTDIVPRHSRLCVVKMPSAVNATCKSTFSSPEGVPAYNFELVVAGREFTASGRQTIRKTTDYFLHCNMPSGGSDSWAVLIVNPRLSIFLTRDRITTPGYTIWFHVSDTDPVLQLAKLSLYLEKVEGNTIIYVYEYPEEPEVHVRLVHKIFAPAPEKKNEKGLPDWATVIITVGFGAALIVGFFLLVRCNKRLRARIKEGWMRLMGAVKLHCSRVPCLLCCQDFCSNLGKGCRHYLRFCGALIRCCIKIWKRKPISEAQGLL